MRLTAHHRFVAFAAAALIAAAVATPVLSQGRAETLGDRIDQRRAQREAPATQDRADPITAPGAYRYTIRHGGLQRHYLVHVPQSWRRGKPMPVVLALHGGGGSAEHMANDRNYALISASEQKGFIAVFPNGVSPLRSGLLATWNAGACCGPARDDGVDDVGFLRAVTARVLAQTGGDAARVYAIGMSNGALMAYRLACEASDMLAGVMAVAGTDNTTRCAPARPVPVLHVHALDDDHVLFNGGAGPGSRRREAVTDFVSVPATIEKWVGLNRAQPQPERILTVPGATCDLYSRTPRGAAVQLCVTETGKHSWPGGTKDRADTPPSQAIRANDVFWDFVNGTGRALSQEPHAAGRRS